MSAERRLPEWLKRRVGSGETFGHTARTVSELGLETICTNANCPNRGECWGRGTATVLILGNVCTRNCRFCSVGAQTRARHAVPLQRTGRPLPPDPDEPRRVAEMARRLGLKYLVITSVDRDDLADGGAGHFRDVITCCRREVEGLQFELLVPDFRDCQDEAIAILGEALPFVFGHNVETVPSQYSRVRPGGDYGRSLGLLAAAKAAWPAVQTKSSIMLGLGEREEEVVQVLEDLRGVGCDRVAIGQYLRPSKDSVEVAEYVTPRRFEWWAGKAKAMGFTWVMASPFTRSSFHAELESTG
jgi:lipoic acid synthetase